MHNEQVRGERWYWLLGFCVVSLCIHIGLALRTHPFVMTFTVPKPAMIEVALEPLPEARPRSRPIPKPASKPAIKPEKRIEHTSRPRPIPLDRGRPFMPARPVVEARQLRHAPVVIAKRVPTVLARHTATAPNVEPGGMDRLRAEKPLPLGLPIGRKDAGAPRFQRIARATPLLGGGSPAPGPVPGGRGGAPTPEAPPEDIVYNGGGAGGIRLPRMAPRIGGGGGRSILSVENPLAREAIPEEKPGLGPGLGSGEGAGAGGGAGYGRGRGIGARLDGRNALATLRSKPGPGIGAGQGAGIGTRPPGGGHGTGAELPGTGGLGFGYGRGHGLGVGPGGSKGSGTGIGVSGGLARGIPFGDITGLLRGDPKGGGGTGGGPGGPGRGGVFGAVPSLNRARGGRIHIVYLLDSSGSMRDGNKIGKAKEALKKALSELKPTDSFDILHFDGQIYEFAPALLPATRANVQQANDYIDDIQLNAFTILSDALAAGLTMEGVTHMFVLSDGEPNGGIEDFDELRTMVRERNRHRVQINTLALGLGEHFRGMELLKAIAAENDGTFAYVNLAQ